MKFPKPGKKKKKKGLSDRWLLALWRKALLIKWKGCFFCRNKNEKELECHHSVAKRKHKLTRYLIENGVPVCKVNWGKPMSCHQYADTREGEVKIKEAIGEEAWSRVDRLAHMNIKDYCLENDITEKEYLLTCKQKLEAVIREEKLAKRFN